MPGAYLYRSNYAKQGEGGRWSHYMLIPLNLSDFDTDDDHDDDYVC